MFQDLLADLLQLVVILAAIFAVAVFITPPLPLPV
jgi:hypothetical protein